jgi:two-component system cell cycle sensor histidine kinase/response regulator CckA
MNWTALILLLVGLAAGAAAGALWARSSAARVRRTGEDGRTGSGAAEQEPARRDAAAGQSAEGERARLAMAVEQAGESIVVTETDGAIRYVNPAFERVTGYRREEVLGKNPRVLKSGRQPEAFYRELWDALARGQTWRGDFVNRRKDGTFFEEEAVISPVRDASGVVVNYVAVKRDVTEERRKEELDRRTQRMEAVAKLAGGIAHDFNNLLTAVIGYADLLLLQLPDNSRSRRHAEEIKRAGARAANVTRQLLAFSRQQVLQPKELGLNEVLSGMETAFRRILGDRIELSILRGDRLGKVKADPSQLEQVLVNLAMRARDAMPSGGKLVVETANADLDDAYARRHLFVRPGPYVMVAVSDTGEGMDEKAQAQLFEPFAESKGTERGLGLSTVYGIVKQSEGYIRVHSEPGSGTTFKIYLPRLDGEAAVRPVPAEQLRGSETVLVVEDEGVVLDILREVLSGQGYNVLTASNGEEGLRVLSSHPGPIHLLLADVVMPMMAGPDLSDRAAALRPETRTLFISGHTEHTVIRHGVSARGAGFLQKPFTPEAVARKVREVLDTAKAS